MVIPFPAPARDKVSELSVKTAGCIKLDGDQALAYARSRHFQSFESGRWREDLTGDIGRIQRQQDFIRRVMRTAISRGARNPLKLNGLVSQGVKYVTIDKTLGLDDIRKLGKRFKSLEPDAVDMLTLPGDNVRVGGAAVLRLKQPDAQQIIDRFSGKIPPPDTAAAAPNIAPNTVRVRVLNGSGVSGQGAKTTAELQKAGFNVAAGGDAKSYTFVTPVIRYGRGQQEKARLLATFVLGGAKLQEDLTLRGIDVELTTGKAFGGIKTAGGAAPATTVKGAAPAATPTPKGAPAGLSC